MQDLDTVEITLTKGFRRGVDRVVSVTMREPTVGDNLAAQRQGGSSDAQVEVALLANLCELTPGELASLSLRDYRLLQDAMVGFTR